MLAWIAWGLVPPGRPRVQSPVLKQDWSGRRDEVTEYVLMIPNDGRQAEYFLGDGCHSKIRITVRRAPVAGKPTPRRVVDQLKRPTQLGNDVIIE